MLNHNELHSIGQKAVEWLETAGFTSNEELNCADPDKVYQKLVSARGLHPKAVNKNMLYALRANYHYQQTGEKLPHHYFRTTADYK